MKTPTYRYTSFAKNCSMQLRKGMTPSEKHLWYDFLHDHQPRFQRQRPIGPYIVDFICYDAALIVELDGEVHNGEAQWNHDEARDQNLRKRGFRIVRFQSRDVFQNFAGVCERIEQAVKDPTIEGRMS